MEGSEGTYRVARFEEKPVSSQAKEYLKQGTYFWNCGTFVWKASAILRELKQHAPDIHSQLETLIGCLQNSSGKMDYLELNEKGCKIFSSLPSISIDYAVMENSSNVAMIPSDIGWNDVGSWSALDLSLIHI